ncbi:MAG TPA: cytochrome c oxidase subunit 3 [Candidatus Baltobacteraceae bacterium]|jgi:heme/copper-type cytochrome/quinol oxidase subunit 3|nr:cytochrome c oxidase subunit 3 [Candidatus Baltobacteraceae bacterium]
MAVLSTSALNANHGVIEVRYDDVDRAYSVQRDLRLLGFALFLLSDIVLFSMFIFAYLYLRNSVPLWPPVNSLGHQLPRFDLAFATMNSVVLFGSGVTMHFALEAWKRVERSAFFAWLFATIVLGVCFLLGQAYEYHSIAITWAGSTMGATFFTLTGMHGLHVFVGVVYLAILGIQASRGVYTPAKYFGLTAGTLYWHFVDVIWVALFFLFYLM